MKGYEMNNKTERVTKLCASERQLKEAIRLFFEQRDSISIHTLAGAAHEVLRDLSKKKGLPSSLKDHSIIRPDRKKEWIKLLNEAQNFFKHADRDHAKEYEFHPVITHHFLWDAIDMYLQLTGHCFFEGQVFRLWHQLKYEDLLLNGYKKSLAKWAKQKGLWNPDDFNTFLWALEHPELFNERTRINKEPDYHA